MYTTHDYICIGPYCWGRSKTAREAYRQARLNYCPSLFKRGYKAPFVIDRLPDDCDEVTVHSDGSYSFNSPSHTDPVTVLKLTVVPLNGRALNAIPEYIEVPQ